MYSIESQLLRTHLHVRAKSHRFGEGYVSIFAQFSIFKTTAHSCHTVSAHIGLILARKQLRQGTALMVVDQCTDSPTFMIAHCWANTRLV